MKRAEQKVRNIEATRRVCELIATMRWPGVPSYAAAVAVLNREGYRTSRGNLWTRRALYRMLQRQSIAGLHGLAELRENGHFPTHKKGIIAVVRA